jgi:hypothetical protein
MPGTEEGNAMTLPREYRLARLVGKAHETRATERAATYARKVACPVYAFRTPKGWAFDIVPPMGACIVAQPSGVVSSIPGPIV